MTQTTETGRSRRSLGRPALLFLADSMLDDEWSSVTFHTLGATHRDSYQALVLARSKRTADAVPRGAARFPEMHTAASVHVRARTSREGVRLGECTVTPAEPSAAFIAHLVWVAAAFNCAGVAVRLVNGDTPMTTALLRTWLTDAHAAEPGSGVIGFVDSFCGRDLSSFLCAPAAATAGTSVTLPMSTLFERTTSVELLGERPADAMLRGLETLTHLVYFNAAAQHMLQTLRPLARLAELVDIDVRETSISDPDMKLIGALPHLQRLHIEACVMLTNLNPLATSRSLVQLGAGQCRQLLHVSRLGDSGAPLRDLDLSDNPLVSTAQLAAVLAAPRQDLRRLNLNGVHVPRDVVRISSGASTLTGPAPPVLHHVTHLHLNGCRLSATMPWLAAAPCLTAVYLNYSNITELLLEAITPAWQALQVLSLTHCLLLRTTLAFALRLTETLTHLQISEHSLVPHHVVAELEQRCVFVQRGP